MSAGRHRQRPLSRMTHSYRHTRPTVDYLRLAVTDRCNLRCVYCMPPEGVPPRRHTDILTYEEMLSFAAVAAQAGIRKVRITGGEPLVRKGLDGFVAMLAALPGISDLSLTTNGILLPRLAAPLRRAGLRRVNISIDSLRPERYAALTRGGRLEDALGGLRAALAAGFTPVKVNVVLEHGIVEELPDFVRLATEQDVHVRFIEHMPIDRRHVTAHAFLPASVVLARLRDLVEISPEDGPYGHGPAAYWRPEGARGTLGFIAGVSEHLCSSCNRLRLTADGRLKTCLFSGEELNVRPLIGRPTELAKAMGIALAKKTYDRRAETELTRRAMSEIGG